MKDQSKISLLALLLAVASIPVLAQGPPQGEAPPPPPSQQGPYGGPRDGGMRRMGPMEGGEPNFQGGAMGRHWDHRERVGRIRPGPEFWGGSQGFLNSPAIRERLAITSGQVAKIHQQDLDFEKAAIRERAGLQVKRIELRELLDADNPDRSAIDAKLNEIGAAQMALEKSAIDNRLALREILTPVQRQQLQQLRENGFRPAGPPQPAPRGPRGNRPPARPGAAPPNPPANQ
jgi:Spy/CpxP family protein refolding chaperone